MKTDKCIAYILSSDRKKRSEALRFLYSHTFPKVETFILSNSGSTDQAKDIFQDAISVVYNNLSQGKFRGGSAITSYLYAISKNLWLMQLRRKKIMTTGLDELQLKEEQVEAVNTGLLRSVLENLDTQCRLLLISFYFYKRSMEELAEEFGLSSTQVAKTKKLRCMKKLSTIVQAKGLEQDHFIL